MQLDGHIVGVGTGEAAHFVVEHGLVVFLPERDRHLQHFPEPGARGRIVVEDDDVHQLRRFARLGLPDENVADADVVVRVLCLHVAAEMTDEFPGLFLLFPKLLHVRDAGSEVLDVFRLFVVPGGKIVGVAPFVGDIPEEQARLTADRFVQPVKVFFADLPAFRGPYGLGERAERFAFRLYEFLLHREEVRNVEDDGIGRDAVLPGGSDEVPHVFKEAVRVLPVDREGQEDAGAVQLKLLCVAHVALNDVVLIV